MAVDEISKMIGDAWELHRKGDQAAAQRLFEDVLQRDSESVDAHYGLGLVKRASGDKAGARAAFESSRSLAKSALEALRAGRETNDLSTTKDDRYMMLLRMIDQRIAEV
jgi:thioredoxin-like negative regulator of GroEL